MLQISELAAKEKLPIKFLEQIFTQPRAAGYVESRRGKFGGYSLAHPMATFFGLFVKNRAKTTMIITKTPAVILSKSARSLIHAFAVETARRDSVRPRKQRSAWLSAIPS
jgi:transcriptional regulator Rrf2-like protein